MNKIVLPFDVINPITKLKFYIKGIFRLLCTFVIFTRIIWMDGLLARGDNSLRGKRKKKLNLLKIISIYERITNWEKKHLKTHSQLSIMMIIIRQNTQIQLPVQFEVQDSRPQVVVAPSNDMKAMKTANKNVEFLKFSECAVKWLPVNINFDDNRCCNNGFYDFYGFIIYRRNEVISSIGSGFSFENFQNWLWPAITNKWINR